MRKSPLQWITFLAFLVLVTSSCGSKKNPWERVDLRGTPKQTIHIHRYEEALFTIDTSLMEKEILPLLDTFAIFLGAVPPDSAGIRQLTDYVSDPFIREIYAKTREVFPDLTHLEKELREAFRHYSYYFPDHPIPEIYTYISGIDYLNAVVYQPPVMLIALDMYLGEDFEPYGQLGLPQYMISRFRKEYLLRDCIQEMAGFHLKDAYPGDNVLQKMILEGKRLYFLDAMIPGEDDAVKISFTEEQLSWCEENEASFWRFFVENELLYSGDIQVLQKFFNDGPFTRGFPGSPSRLGSWLGWQVIRSYMTNHPEVTLQQLLQEQDAQAILNASGYKPQKK